jgi:hypothetical protein
MPLKIQSTETKLKSQPNRWVAGVASARVKLLEEKERARVEDMPMTWQRTR